MRGGRRGVTNCKQFISQKYRAAQWTPAGEEQQEQQVWGGLIRINQSYLSS